MSTRQTTRHVGLVALFMFVGLGLVSCSRGSECAVRKPGKLDPNTCPVALTRPTVSPMSSSVMGQCLFVGNVTNVSHVDISAVKAMAVLFDATGQRLGEPQEVGISPDVGDIAPGASGEFKFTTGKKEAVRAVLVVKEVLYVMVPEGKGMEMYRVPTMWKNPAFDAELEAAAK